MKSENIEMKNYKNNLSERLLNFASEVIKLVIKINKDDIGRHIGYCKK